MSCRDRLAAAAARLIGTRGAVLCFHGLALEGEPSRPSIHIPLELLKAIVLAVRNFAQIVSLQEVVTRYLAGYSTAGLVALTADDAYASWLAAEEFLLRQEIPLTVFAVTDALGAGPRFWWDRIDNSAAQAHPERWRRFEDDCVLPEAYREGQPASEGLARPLRQWVLAEHAGRWPTVLEASLARLEDDLGCRTPQRSMTEPELSGFLTRTGTELGVHTVSHAALPFLPDQEVIAEVRQGYEVLRGRFPGALPYLAIPFGLFDARTLRLAAEAGMTVSLTLAGSPLDRPFAANLGMPRLCVVREHAPGMLALKASGVAPLVSRLRRRSAPPYPVLPSPTT